MKAVAVECIGIGLAYGVDGSASGPARHHACDRAGRVLRAARAVGLGQVDAAAADRRLQSAQRGRLLVDGHDISGVPPHARNIGMVFQSYALWPHMNVTTTWPSAWSSAGCRATRSGAGCGEALELVGLADYASAGPNQLSGGQQQRVALARTIVIEPQVLLLDEPLSNLDTKLREQMRDELKRLQRTLGITTIFVTHDQEEAMTTADRMAVLDGGVLQQVGTPRELFDAPANRFVADFVGSTNVLAGRVDAARGIFVADGLGEVPLPAASSGTALSIRPHALAVATQRDERRVWFDGLVREIEFLGEFTRYEIGVGAITLTADAPHLSSSPLFERGARVQVGLDPAELRVLD